MVVKVMAKAELEMEPSEAMKTEAKQHKGGSLEEGVAHLLGESA